MISITFCVAFFIFGTVFGMIIGLFIAGIGKNNKQYDSYQEGFIDGYNRGKEK